MESLMQLTFYILTALLPLIFTSVNSELFEFPKFLILLTATIIIGTAWFIHMMATRSFRIFVRTPYRAFSWLQWSVLGVLVTQTLATFTSIQPYTSFWGYYSRFHQGLLTTICYTILFFAAINWLDRKSIQKIINISIKTAFVISIIAILEHYNVSVTCMLMTAFSHMRNSAYPFIGSASCWGNSTNPLYRSFATIGQPNWLAAYILLHIPLIFYRLKLQQQKSLLWYIYFAVLLSALIFTKSRSGFIAFGASVIVYWLLDLRNGVTQETKRFIAMISVVIIALSSVIGTPFTGNVASLFTPHQPVATPEPSTSGSVLESGNVTESGDIRKIVWSGALSLISHHPLLGTGPETFAYTYYWERPVAHNYTSEWDFLYNKAHNEYLNIAATTGLIGVSAYLAWHLVMAALSLVEIEDTKKTNKEKEKDLRAYLPVMASSVVAFGITNFFGFSVIPVYYAMTLLSAVPLAELAEPKDKHPLPLAAYGYTVSIIVVAVYFLPLRLFLADYYYTLGKSNNSIADLRKAVALRPAEDLFHSALAEAYATHANDADAKELALREAAFTAKHNPYHLNYFKSRVKVYLAFAASDPTYYTQAASELARARQLAPTDPKLAYNLGLVYSRLGDIEKAETQINQAIELKKDYADAYYALTLLYEQTKQTDKIPQLLTTAQSNLATYSALLKEKIDKYTPAVTR